MFKGKWISYLGSIEIAPISLSAGWGFCRVIRKSYMKLRPEKEGKLIHPTNKRRWFLYLIISLLGGIATTVVFYFFSLKKKKETEK